MPKKIIRRKSSSSRHPERSRGISRSRPLSFWNFIRKNFLIIAGLLLLPVTVGAVLSSYNYANQSSAAGKPRKITLSTQDRELTPLGADQICGNFANAKSHKMFAIDCGSCGYRCYSDPNSNIDLTYLGTDLTHNVPIENPECLGLISRAVGCGIKDIPPPSPTPAKQPLGPAKVNYEVLNCDNCRKRFDFPPYDQWCDNPIYGGGNCSDYYTDVSRTADSACAAAIASVNGDSGNCGTYYDPNAQRPTAGIQQPTSVPPAGGGGELKCDCLPKPGDDCDGARIGNDGCPDGEGSLGQACCKTVTTKSGFDLQKSIKNFFGIFGF